MTAGRKSAGGGTKNKSRCISSGSGYARKRESIAATLVLTSSFGLLLPLEARADLMLTLLDLSNHAFFGTAALKTTQSTLQRLVLLDANFRHCFPSLRCIRLDPGCFQGRYNGINYYSQSQVKSQAISTIFFKLLPISSRAAGFHHFTMRLTSLFLTTMLLRSAPPVFSRKRAIFSSASAV